MRFTSLIILFFSGLGMPVLMAQTAENKSFTIENARAVRQGDSVVVTCRTVVEPRAVKRNSMLQLTPELVANDNACILSELELAGRARFFFIELNDLLA